MSESYDETVDVRYETLAVVDLSVVRGLLKRTCECCEERKLLIRHHKRTEYPKIWKHFILSLTSIEPSLGTQAKPEAIDVFMIYFGITAVFASSVMNVINKLKTHPKAQVRGHKKAVHQR